jgi:hypothetical protein
VEEGWYETLRLRFTRSVAAAAYARMMMTTQGTGQGAGIGRAAFLRG